MRCYILICLRLALHNCPKRSGQEDQTRAVLMDFLASHTTLELRPCGAGFYAAYLKHGLSLAQGVGRLLCALPELADPAGYSGMALCTVAGVKMGERSFGTAAAQAEMWVVLTKKTRRAISPQKGEVDKFLVGICRLHWSG